MDASELNDNSKPILIQLFKPTLDIPRLSFILKNNNIYMSWSKKKCTLKQKFSTQLSSKFKLKKIRVSSGINLYEKLSNLIENPTYKDFSNLFKINKSYLPPNEFESNFKGIKAFVYTI
jgi:hypothetical protein